ncbi:ATP-binding protein [Flavihumibacter petaseus]|uniref:histidine kinase n=1 Tax=Flavihumibacter petaseus NBRC 106054 TaxID=1220578 RepID=A0A0E9N5B6_9BACT|nr:ATP-binding protein [Flavihumibacter petaseus]GAO45162.1 putative two-component histidine kinase [Flavihumibacter petaseus NBRC 106054]
MQDIARITLENELDLILAHKRSMKLAELAGLGLSAQTTFATAVSEIARNIIESGKQGFLDLKVDAGLKQNYIVASLIDQHDAKTFRQGIAYARKLVHKFQVLPMGNQTKIDLHYRIQPSFRIDISRIDEWRNIFRNEPPVSPYDELKRKNELLQDLSERLQQSESQYKTLTNTLPIAIFTMNREARLLYANQWMYRLSGLDLDELNLSRWSQVVHERDYPMFRELIDHGIINSDHTIKTALRIRYAPDGSFLWHELSLTPLADEQSGVQYWIGALVDIHAQKLVEATLKDNFELKEIQLQLEKYQQKQEEFISELNRSNQELQQFAFVASHDLQEPVRKVLYYSDWLLTQTSAEMSGKSREYLVKMNQSATRMRTLIQDLLVFSQINRNAIHWENIDLQQLALEIAGDFDMVVAEANATLQIIDLPHLEADKRMMSQLIRNMISNALKYSSPDRPPVIRLEATVDKDFVTLAFIDNGIGFETQYLPQMLTLFQRLHDRSQYEGTGLGLAICKKIIDIHHGKVNASSQPGVGSTFYVTLPRTRFNA